MSNTEWIWWKPCHFVIQASSFFRHSSFVIRHSQPTPLRTIEHRSLTMNPGLILIASGFGSIVMLLWSAAALVPLVIHLWNRSRYQEAPWAAMEYLLAALKQNAAPHSGRAVVAARHPDGHPDRIGVGLGRSDVEPIPGFGIVIGATSAAACGAGC